MAVGGSAVIGKVAIKVLPDTSDFKDKLKVQLERIEKQSKLTVPVKFDMTAAKRELLQDIRDLNVRNRTTDARKVRLYTKLVTTGIGRQLNEVIAEFKARAKEKDGIQIKTDLVAGQLDLTLSEAALARVKAEIERFRRQISPVFIPVRLGLSPAGMIRAEAQLDELARDRKVKLKVNLDRDSVASAIAGLSGLRIVDKLNKANLDLAKNLDNVSVRLGKTALASGSLASSALALSANLLSVGQGLVSIAGAGYALPGILGGLVIGLGVTAVALKDFPKVLPDVVAGLKELGSVISGNFWTQAEQPIRRFFQVLLPQFRDGVAQTATAVGGYFKNLADSLRNALNGQLAGMFAKLNESIRVASGGTNALANIITVLGRVGTQYLPRLAQFFVDVTNKFSAFLTRAEKDGSLKGWIEEGITNLKALGSVVANIGGIFAGLSRAAQAAGAGTLQTLASGLKALNQQIKSDAGQAGITKVFAAAITAVKQFIGIAGPALAQFGAALAETFSKLGILIGNTVGALVDNLAQVLGSSAIQTGILALFQGLQAGVTALAPALQTLAAPLGALLQFAGNFLSQIGPVIGAFLEMTAMADELLGPLQGIVDLLAGSLTQAFRTLTPYTRQVAVALGKVIPVIGDGLRPVFEALLGILSKLAPIFADLISRLLPPLATALSGLLTAIAPLLAKVGDFAAVLLEDLAPVIGDLVARFLPPLSEALGKLVSALSPLIDSLMQLWETLSPVLVPVLKFLAELLLTSLIGAIDGLTNVVKGLGNVFQGVAKLIDDIVHLRFGKILGDLVQIVSGVFRAIFGLIETWFYIGAVKLFTGGFGLIKGIFSEGWAFIKGLFTNGFTALKGAVLQGMENVASFFRSGFTKVWDIVSNIFKSIGKLITDFPNQFSAIVGRIGSAASSIGGAIKDGILNGLKAAGRLALDIGRAVVNSIIDLLNDALHNLGSFTIPVINKKINLNGLIPSIPHLADGGTVLPTPGGTLALLAEAGRAETVVDTDKLNRLFDKVLRSENPSNGGRVLNYYAAPNNSLDSEEDLFAAAERSRFVF